MKAFVFPGQGAQFPGMGSDLYASSKEARELFNRADEILGFGLSEIMFHGSAEDLKETKVTQPAIFLHSIALFKALKKEPAAVAGHSLGEFSALVAAGVLSFEDGLILVSKRALAMQKVCEAVPSSMAAILALDEKTVEEVCDLVEGTVVAANYNCPGQIVISGEKEALSKACALLKERGARRALPLSVSGAFHSPLMEPAKEELSKAIYSAKFSTPFCPVYQNVDAMPHTDISQLRENLVLQLTSPVRWTHIVLKMIQDGITSFTEVGPGSVLQGLIRKTNPQVEVVSINTL
ncbi:MAG: ACP S-malonyltransferase [Alistipes sp.]|nr:ACP S-malonyltransferase [Candidatus Alistipes equi]